MKTFEKKLKRLFDYQRFEKEKELDALITETVQESERVLLSDNELSFAFGGKKEEEPKKDPFKDE